MPLPASWTVYRDDDDDDEESKTVRLQIELGDGYAVLLTVSRKGGANVTLWRGNGEVTFSPKTDFEPAWTPEDFAAWCDEAVMVQDGEKDEERRQCQLICLPARIGRTFWQLLKEIARLRLARYRLQLLRWWVALGGK